MQRKLVSSVGASIEVFEPVFKYAGVPIMTENEIELLDEKTVFKLINPKLINANILIALLKRFNKFSDENIGLLTQWIVSQLRNMNANEDVVMLLVAFMYNNQVSNDNIFSFIMRRYYNSMHDAIAEYLNNLDKISESYLAELNDKLFVANFKENIYEAMLKYKFYVLYLANRICARTLSQKDYDLSIFDEAVLKELQMVKPKFLFLEYRKYLLEKEFGDKENYNLLYNRNTPFLTKDEMENLSCECFADIYGDDNMPIGIDNELIDFIKCKVETAENAYIMAKTVLKSTNLNEQDVVFESIPFAPVGYNLLEFDKKLEIKNLYNHLMSLNSASEIIAYMKMTNDVEILEKELTDIITEDFNDTDVWDEKTIIKFVEVCNRIGYVSVSLIDLIVKSNLELPLCDAITDELFAIKNYRQFIKGRTLFHSNFSYTKGIPFSDYLYVYANASKQIWSLMKESNEFLVDIYNTNSFDMLSIEQLFLYNDWNQKIELIKAVLEKCENDEQRAKYILNIRALSSLKDSDDFQRYICSTKYSSLMFRDDVSKKVKELLWNEHPAIKANLTKWLKNLKN